MLRLNMKTYPRSINLRNFVKNILSQFAYSRAYRNLKLTVWKHLIQRRDNCSMSTTQRTLTKCMIILSLYVDEKPLNAREVYFDYLLDRCTDRLPTCTVLPPDYNRRVTSKTKIWKCRLQNVDDFFYTSTCLMTSRFPQKIMASRRIIQFRMPIELLYNAITFLRNHYIDTTWAP